MSSCPKDPWIGESIAGIGIALFLWIGERDARLLLT
jgi:hypothetical protein